MGLDITAYRKIELLEPITLAELKATNFEHPLYDADGYSFFAVVDEEHAHKSPPEGIYMVEGELKFHAGSYHGYNSWRKMLAALVNTTPEACWDGAVPEAFGELIHFSDCEGTLKSEVCAKLAKDFQDWRLRAAMTGRKFTCSACLGNLTHVKACEAHKEQLACLKCGAMFDPKGWGLDLSNNELSTLDGAFFFQSYEEWRQAFEFAADGGAVDFH